MSTPLDFSTVDITLLLSDPTVQQLLDIATEHPDWTIQQMVANHPKNTRGEKLFTYEQARAILHRLNLSTAWRRKLRFAQIKNWEYGNEAYKQKVLSQIVPELFSYVKYRLVNSPPKQTPLPQQFPIPTPAKREQPRATPAPQIGFSPAQQTRFRQFDQFFLLAKQFGITFAFSFLFFFTGSLVFDVVFHATTIPAKIGMFFAFLSLACGMIFFLYSLKYYLSIAVVLSFSSETEENRPRKGIGGFLQSLFGISVEVTTEKEMPQPSPRSSLSYGAVMDTQLQRQPFVSIQVGTYNEKRVIDRFLIAATSMEYGNYEVIVADDSTDETVQLLQQWEKHPRVKISHRNTRSGYKGAALAQALQKVDSRTEFILIFDADFIPYPDTITQFLKYFQHTMGSLNPETLQQSNIAAVQGYQWHILNKSENWITRGIRSEYSGSYVIERTGTERYHGLEQISGSVYMIRKNILEQIGWGTSLTEDFELTLRLYEKGYKVVYTPYIQAPAEAVSTIKRLIRQRMRWAEGHSFNVKRLFKRLIWGHTNGEVFVKSPLTWAEKFEFVYLAPYYLQAFLFLLGMFSWFLSEVVFRTRLPFWTETWGWSLVFTNLFALPLMNLVGLFMENSEERDYRGLISFVILSYVVAPFQAFAAVKGFLEKEEGPWFRTPKTGRITDSFVPSKFSRFIKSVFGKPTAAVQSSPSFLQRPAFAISKTNQGFSPKRSRGMRWQGKSILAIFLVFAISLNYLAFFTQKVQAAGNPTIEQQINIMDGTDSTGGSYAGVVLIDTAAYTGATYYFEVYASVTSGTGSVTLTYNAGTGAIPSGGSTVTISNITTTAQLYRSAAITSPALSGAQNAYVSAMTGTGISAHARIIIVQTNSTLITKTATQLEIGGTGYNDNTTSTSFIRAQNPKFWKYDSSKYDGTVNVYFEATMYTNSSGNTMTAELVPSGTSCGTAVTSVTTDTSGNIQRIRSADIGPNGTNAIVSGTTYMVCYKAASSSNLANLSNAKLIIVQTSSGGLTKMEIQHCYNIESVTTAGTGYFVSGNTNQYTPANWAGGTFTYFYAGTLTVNGGTGDYQLRNTTDSSDITSSLITTTSTSDSYVVSSSVTMPGSTKTLDMELQNTNNSFNATIEGSWLIIDVSSLSTPENVLIFFPIIPFLPKIVLYFKKRRKTRLATTSYV